MKINSARQAWHDCKYNPAPGQTSDVVQLGVVVQNTERGPTANHAVHGALAGHIQSAIARLHPQIRVFGDFMYAAEQSDDIREAAEEVVFLLVQNRSPRMTAAKREKLEFVAEAGPGDFIYVPPYVPHQEINASDGETLECVLVRSDNEAVVVNLDIEPAEKPENIPWIDPIHRS